MENQTRRAAGSDYLIAGIAALIALAVAGFGFIQETDANATGIGLLVLSAIIGGGMLLYGIVSAATSD